MSLRLRIVLSLAALAAAATSVASVTAYLSTRSQLYGEVDDSLDEVAALVSRTGDRPQMRPSDGTVPSSTGTSSGTVPYSLPSYRDIERETRSLVYATQLLDRSGALLSNTLLSSNPLTAAPSPGTSTVAAGCSSAATLHSPAS